jgi:imidazolonepropionase-like amidohydrolase
MHDAGRSRREHPRRTTPAGHAVSPAADANDRSRPGSGARTLFHAGDLFDGTGADPRPADVVVEHDRVVSVGAPGTGDADQDVDLRGRSLLPGLFDCHVHVVSSGFDVLRVLQEPFSYRFFRAARNLEATLRAGITSARDAGGADAGVRRAVEDGLVPGPRLQISIDMLSQTGGHGDEHFPCGANVPIFSPTYPGKPGNVVDGPDEMRRAVRELIGVGADVLKVATSGGVLSQASDPRRAHFRPAELDVLVEEATAAGRFVMAHAQAGDGVKNAVRAGIRSIEHGVHLDDEAIDLMVARGTWLVPTLVAPIWVLEAAEAGAGITDASLRKAREGVEAHADSFERAVAAGVKVAMGTDAGVGPHGENLRELPLMAAGGMSPAAVLRSTTQEAARLLGVDEARGSVEEGKLADLVVVEGDPFALDDLGARISQVWKAGERVR